MTSVCRFTGAALVAGCVALLPAPAAYAAAKAPAKSASKSKPKTISREELRACMDQQDRITAMRQKVMQEESSLDKQRIEVSKMDAELERKRAALDPADAAGKEALTTEEAKRNQIADAYNARLPAVREQAAAVNTERQSWVDRCANKNFDEIDEYAIKRDRQTAAKAAAGK